MIAEDKDDTKLDTPRKCLDWAKKKHGWSDDQARTELGLPKKDHLKNKPVPGGPFVSTGDAELDKFLRAAIVLETKPVDEPIDPELQLDVAGDRWWQWRERDRMAPKSGKPPRIIPYFLSSLHDGGRDKFVYCSRKEPDKIIYTPDAAYGRADRRVLTTVGRFLTKHYGDMFSPGQIKKMAEEHNSTYSNPTVYFCFGSNDIVNGYENGPGSCMVKKNFNLIENPVGIYDGPDTLLAIIKRGDKISARALIDVRPTPMTYSRIYGDEPMLSARLQSLGFVNKMGFKGARLRKVIEPKYDRPLCPYIDGHAQVGIVGDFLQVDAGGMRCSNQHGLAGASDLRLVERAGYDFACHCCGATRNEGGNQQNDYEGRPICATCLTEQYCYAVRDRNGMMRYYPSSQCVWVEDTERWYVNHPSILEAHHIAMSGFHGDYVCTENRIFSQLDNGWFTPDDLCTPLGHPGEQRARDLCYTDPEGRYVLVDEAEQVGKFWVHPGHLPACVRKTGKKYELV